MSAPPTSPDLSILIVAYNSADMIEACIASIAKACTRYECEVLMVDNGDGSTERLVNRRFPDVAILPSRGNIGFAAGNNLLAKEAQADKILLLNPDVELEPNSLDALLDGASRHSDAAAWGGVTLDARGLPDSGNAIAMPSMIEFISVALGRSLVGASPIKGIEDDAPVDVLSGGFVMFDRKAWTDAKGLDERFFLYCEEVDLFYRMQKQGHTFWRIADARAYHAVGHGAGLSPMRLLYRAAGTMQFLRHHWSWPKRSMAAFLMWLAAMERYIFGRLLGRWRPGLKAMSQGYNYVALRPAMWWHGYDHKRGLLAQLGRNKKAL